MRLLLIIAIIGGIFAIAIGGFILINNYIDDNGNILIKDDISFNDKDNSTETSETENDDNTYTKTNDVTSGGGSGSSSSNDINTEHSITCRNQYIQYSLKNFYEDVQCVENFEGKCIKVKALCSVDLYNLDVNVDGNFEIEYSLVDSSDNKIDSVVITNNVKIEFPKTFSANFTIEDIDGCDYESTCKIEIKIIPTKEVCS